jgi:hypothetical protein
MGPLMALLGRSATSAFATEAIRARMSAIGKAPCREGADFDPEPTKTGFEIPHRGDHLTQA